MIHNSLPVLYRGSVKDVLGPAVLDGAHGCVNAAVFEYTDAYSVFDWGRMPDALKRKGEALAILAAHWFERLAKPEIWREFSKSHEALGLRKGSRFGAAFNEIGEELQTRGLETHYLGLLEDSSAQPRPLSEIQHPVRHLAVRHVHVVKPTMATVLGRSLPDYYETRNAPAPRLIPLEVVFRFSCPEGSSLLARVERDPGYLASIGFPETTATPGQKWEFPIVELFTKLESSDRPVSLSEALAISGISASQLQDMLLRTAWVAGLLRWMCAQAGFELADGKLEWALSETGTCFLVDAIGPDELRLLKVGSKAGSSRPIQLSKEFLRTFYRSTPWFEQLEQAKAHGKMRGVSDWKKWVKEKPPGLTPLYVEMATHLYLALVNQLTGKTWFPDAWTIEQVVESIERFGEA